VSQKPALYLGFADNDSRQPIAGVLRILRNPKPPAPSNLPDSIGVAEILPPAVAKRRDCIQLSPDHVVHKTGAYPAELLAILARDLRRPIPKVLFECE